MKLTIVFLYTLLCVTISAMRIVPTIHLSNYSSELSTEYETFYRPEGFSSGHYYESIQIIVKTTSSYDFQCASNMDTYGFIYNGSFTRLTYEPRNFIARDNDRGGHNQFQFEVQLKAGGIYSLVVTTYNSGATGPFSIIASGPDDISFVRIDIPRAMESTTVTTTHHPSSSTTVSISNMIVSSNYMGELTLASNKYPQTELYYQAIKIEVNTTGTYDLSSRSYIDAYGCLYEGSFNPSFPFTNRLVCIDNYMGIHFNIRYILQAKTSYTLIFTTHSPNTIGSFMIVGTGPDKVDFISI